MEADALTHVLRGNDLYMVEEAEHLTSIVKHAEAMFYSFVFCSRQTV